MIGNLIPWSAIYWVLPLSAACICSFIAFYLLGHQHQSGAKPLTLLMAAVAVWSLAYAMELRSSLFETKLWWVKIEYIGAGWVGLFGLHFILVITGKSQWLTAGRFWLLAAIPVATPFLAFTNEFHRLMWETAWLDITHSKPVVAYVRGVGFWIMAGYSYALLLAGTVILLTAYRKSLSNYRRQIGIIIVGIALPWLSNALYLVKSSPIKALDLTPFAFTVSGIIFCFGLFRYQLLDIMPIAREALLKAIGDAVLVLDLQDRIVDKNSRADDLLEIGFGQVILQKAANIFPMIYDNVKKLKKQETDQIEIELGRDGDKKNFDLRVSPLFSGKDRHVGWLICLRDITESKRAEAALRDSEEKFRSISDNALDGIVMIDPDGKVSFWNRAAEAIFGYNEMEIIGKELHSVLAPSRYLQEYFQRFTEFLATGAGPVIGKTVELSALKKNGKEFPIELSVSNLFLKGQWHAVGIVRDITERKREEAERVKLQDRLQCAQKMEALGLMAGGVAHDLNNVLSGIVSYPELLLMDLPESSPLKNPIETIKKSGEKAAEIVQDLLALARRGVRQTEVLNLNDIISDHLRSPEYEKMVSYHPGVRITTALEKNLFNMMGASIHIKKSIMNLITNAAEAQPTGGEIKISTENRYVDRSIKGCETVAEGEYVVLNVEDSGIGIDPEDMNRIFEPFYTKKVMGRSGTGLGMAVVWGTVQDHKGYIHTESNQGKGTRFELYFPATREEIFAKEYAVPINEYMGNNESVLIIDDVEEQREITARMLTILGYCVTKMSSGEAAFAYLNEHTADVILLDMIMDPGMDGLETYKHIITRHPHQKAIITSGFSETDRVRELQEIGAGKYIKKPYSLEKIGLAIRDELKWKGAHRGIDINWL